MGGFGQWWWLGEGKAVYLKKGGDDVVAERV